MSNTLTLKDALKTQFSLVEPKTTNGAPLSLKDGQAEQALISLFDKSLFQQICKNHIILENNKLSISIQKTVGSKFQPKSAVGQGTPNKWRITKPFTIAWNEPVTVFEAITAFEQTMLPVDLAASKAAKVANQWSRIFERTAFKQLENKIIDDSMQVQKDLANLTANEIYNELVSKATALTETVDVEQGIDLIDRENVVIMVKPTIFDKLAQAKLTGNGTLESFSLGQYAVSHIAGYKIFANPFLKQFDAIVAADFIGFGGQAPIAMNFGKVDNLSNDTGFYFEGKDAYAILYNKLAYGFAGTSKSKQDEDKRIELPADKENLKDE
ncbi:hypothetical protein AAW50_03525 [Mycoplasmopsis canis]|uniref:hypothetical protein n=1 Tax=Mycoplasmopsis canis TaxID=29555 RepID=UPI000624D97B|nr:hypothetical protein [Mycoplasmopsis canis]AKF41026.1 hypothetical protein AAW50_01050 [Mycoplasmopsis canis]AKF41459.1 hypothetical protein AAW50_03525 [Mycoplasmopsis canis]